MCNNKKYKVPYYYLYVTLYIEYAKPMHIIIFCYISMLTRNHIMFKMRVDTLSSRLVYLLCAPAPCKSTMVRTYDEGQETTFQRR